MPRLIGLCVILLAAIGTVYLWTQYDAGFQAVPAPVTSTDIPPAKPSRADTADVKTESDEHEKNSEPVFAGVVDDPDVIVVRGTIRNQSGQGVGGMQIEIKPKILEAWQTNIHSTRTDRNGEFLFEAIPPGVDYRLEVLASGAYSGALLKPFIVQHGMAPVTLVLESFDMVAVNGMIIGVDDAPITGFEILVRNVGIAYPGRKVASDTSGVFNIDQFPAGEIEFSTTGDEHFKITGITLAPGEYRNLSLALDKGGYHLSGWVTDEFNTPIAQARVVLTSDFSRDDYHSSSFRFKSTDKNGGFEFSGLGGQGHKLTVDAMGHKTKVIDYQFRSVYDYLNIRMRRE